MNIENLICPYCGCSLVLGDVYKEIEDEIIYGCASCPCSEYPIVESIVYLMKNAINDRVIENLKKGWLIKSFHSLSVPAYRYNLDRRNNVVFFDIMREKNLDNYLKHRFSSETFWQIYPIIYLMDKEDRKNTVLDIGCGTGHSSYLFSTYLKPRELVCLDKSFRHLYLLKKFFVDDAFCICSDANNLLPFREDSFDSIHAMDSYHYVFEKKRLSNELERTVKPNGLLMLLHLHNSLQSNPGAGYPLTPQEWMALFEETHPKAIPEKSITEDFLFKGELDVKKKSSQEELNSSNAISIIASSKKLSKGIYKDIWKYVIKIKVNLTINPLYQIRIRDNNIILTRQFPSEFYRRNYPITEKYLPNKYVIGSEIGKHIINRKLDLTGLNEENVLLINGMIRKYVLINAPAKYI